MDVRTLITELLEFPLDLEVNMEVSSDEETLSIDNFNIWEVGNLNKRLEISMETPNHVILEKRDYTKLIDDMRDLEDELSDSRSEVTDLYARIG